MLKLILMTDVTVEDKGYKLPISSGLSYSSVREDLAEGIMSRNIKNIQVQPVPSHIQSTFRDAKKRKFTSNWKCRRPYYLEHWPW